MSEGLLLDVVTLLADLLVAGVGVLCLLAARAEREYRRECRRGLTRWVGRDQ